MENLIPKNTPENTVSGGGGGRMMGELRFCGGIEVWWQRGCGEQVVKSPTSFGSVSKSPL